MEDLQNLMNWKTELHVPTAAPHVSAGPLVAPLMCSVARNISNLEYC